MKIFGWMHKKLHMGTAEYHRVAHRNSPDALVGEVGGGKSGSTRPVDTEALLLPRALLLTIGTFGHIPPPPTPSHEEDPPAFDLHQQVEEIDHDSTAVGKQSTPAAAAAFHSSDAKIEPTVERHAKQEIEIVEEEEIMGEEPLLKEDNEKIERRTTLADLFAAETAAASSGAAAAAADGGALPSGASTFADKRQPDRPTKKAKKAKKGKETHSSAKKIQGLITRMLKKRIHPDAARWEREERHGGQRGASDGGHSAACYRG